MVRANSGKSKLRAGIKVMSVVGLTYNCMVDHQTTMAYCRCGKGKDQLVDDAVARLCQGECFVYEKNGGCVDYLFPNR